MSAELIARVLAAREAWVDLEPGKRVRIRRPSEAELPSFRAGVTAEKWARCCVGWEGFSEADVLGAALGSGNSMVPFDLDLWVTLALDRLEWVGAVSAAVVESITAHLDARSTAGKN